jgi:hypothetical protein
MTTPAPGIPNRLAHRTDRSAGAEILDAVGTVHRAVLDLRARHFGRFPVLGERTLRDADSAWEFARRLASSREAVGEATGEVARATRVFLESLLFDCREFLRQRGLGQWSADDLRAMEVRTLARRVSWSPGQWECYLPHPESAVNAVICLVQHAAFLIDDCWLRRGGRARFVTVAGPACRLL